MQNSLHEKQSYVTLSIFITIFEVFVDICRGHQKKEWIIQKRILQEGILFLLEIKPCGLGSRIPYVEAF